MSEKTEYEMMWGAKVKTPTAMPDDILKDAISTAIRILSECKPNDENDEANAAIQQIKDHMDEKWTPNWHVVCGRSFGSLVTHEANRFVYFYVGDDKAVMIYKA